MHPNLNMEGTWPFSKSKFNLMSDRVNLECQLYLPNVRAIQYKLGPERLTRFGNLNILRLPVKGLISCCITDSTLRPHNCSGLHFQTPEGDKESLLSCKLFIKKFFFNKKTEKNYIFLPGQIYRSNISSRHISRS